MPWVIATSKLFKSAVSSRSHDGKSAGLTSCASSHPGMTTTAAMEAYSSPAHSGNLRFGLFDIASRHSQYPSPNRRQSSRLIGSLAEISKHDSPFDLAGRSSSELDNELTIAATINIAITIAAIIQPLYSVHISFIALPFAVIAHPLY